MITFTDPTDMFPASRRPSRARVRALLSPFDRAGRVLLLDTLRPHERAYFGAEPLI